MLAIIDRKKLRNGGRERSRSDGRKRGRKKTEGESDGEALLSTEGSYTSLDKLPETEHDVPSSEGLHQRRHSRGSSLETGISLDYLREATRRGSGSFDEVTADLNREVSERRRKQGKNE